MTKKTTKKTKKVAKTPVKAAVATTPKTEARLYEKKESCACGSECKCGPDCTCGQSACRLAFVMFVLAVVAAVFSAAAWWNTRNATVKAAPAGTAECDCGDFIKKNPQLILDSVNAYFEEQQREEEAKNAVPESDVKDIVASITKDKTNHVAGNPNGSFVMIEFFDYNCGYCKRMNKAMGEAIKKSNNIRWILIDAPIFGEDSERIARYAHAASKQGKFEQFHAALADVSNPNATALEEIGKKLGLDIERLRKDADSKEAKDKIVKNREYITRLKLSGVPMFIIDGEVQKGAFGDDKMKAYIEKANARK